MVDPSDCPAEWEQDPSGIRIDRRTHTVIENVWKNSSTGAMIIHFSVQHHGDNHIVEVHHDPEELVSRFEQITNVLSSGSFDGEISQVSAMNGEEITRERSENAAIQAALDYMEE